MMNQRRKQANAAREMLMVIGFAMMMIDDDESGKNQRRADIADGAAGRRHYRGSTHAYGHRAASYQGGSGRCCRIIIADDGATFNDALANMI